jgi:hypothetical protein
MKRTRNIAITFVLVFVIGFLAFGQINAAHAPPNNLNKYEKWMKWNNLEDEQRIRPETTIDQTEKSFLRIGMGQSEEERENGEFFGPYDVNMWVSDILGFLTTKVFSQKNLLCGLYSIMFFLRGTLRLVIIKWS